MVGVEQIQAPGPTIVPAPATAPDPAVSEPTTGMDQRELRGTLGLFATGITVIAAGSDEPHGMTANAFTSVSLDPPLVLVCVNRQAVMHGTIVTSGSFAVSVLSGGQEKLARYFADRSRPPGRAQFEQVDWRPGGRTGAPILGGALAWLECELREVYQGGDHSIFVGQVLEVGRCADQVPLLFFGGSYHRLSNELEAS